MGTLIGSLVLLAEGIIGFWLMDGHHSNSWYKNHPESERPALTRSHANTQRPVGKVWVEIGFEVCLELLLFLFQYSSDQMEMPHNFWVGFSSMIAGIIIAARMIYIFPLWGDTRLWRKNTTIAVFIVVVLVGLGKPVLVAYRKPWVHLSFRDDDDLTWLRQQVIAYDVSRMHDYLISLDIAVPEQVPSFTVTDSEGMVGRAVPPLYREYMELRRTHLKDRSEPTWQYLNYVLSRLFKSDNSDIRIIEQSGLFQIAVREYYQKSFWKRTDEDFAFAVVLLAIRKELGDEFTDKLVSHFVRIEADIPRDIIDSDSHVTFLNGLREADKDIESHMQHWGQIQKIIKRYKFKVDMEYEPAPQ